MRPLISAGGGSVDYRFRHRDGHYIWVQDTFRVVCDEDGAAARARRSLGRHLRAQASRQDALQANIALQETKRYLTRLLESSTDAVFSTDKAGNVVVFNQGAEDLLDYRAEDVVGHHIALLYGERGRRTRCRARDAQARGHRVGLRDVLKSQGRTATFRC